MNQFCLQLKSSEQQFFGNLGKLDCATLGFKMNQVTMVTEPRVSLLFHV